MSDSRRQAEEGAGWWNVVPILFLLLLDIGFNGYFWRIPKLTEPWIDYGYGFLLETHYLHRPKPPGATRVVAFGSSVVGSFDRYQVGSLIEAQQPSAKLDVHRLLMPGIKPSDSRLFFETERGAMQPDIVVLVLNVADFLNPGFERDLKEQVRYVLPPWRTLRARHAYLSTVSSELDLVLASASNLYRYRKAIRSCVQDHAKLLLSSLRHRTPQRAYGLYRDGYTKPVFGLPLDHADDLNLDYFVSPAWLQQRGRVTLDFSVGGQRLAERVETDPGWKTISLRAPAERKKFLRVVADGYWVPRASGLGDDTRLLGVQLREPLPLGTASRGAATRRDPSVDHRQVREFLRLGNAVGQEFAGRWWQAVSADTPFGERMRAYQKSILGIRQQPFRARGEHAELERLIASFSEHGVSVIVVNSPESPLIFDQYKDSPYYAAHVRFLRGLAHKYKGVSFHDLAAALPAEDFNDWHHVNYVGASRLGERYAEFIRQVMSERLERSVAGAQE